jgi:hypothetical protein
MQKPQSLVGPAPASKTPFIFLLQNCFIFIHTNNKTLLKRLLTFRGCQPRKKRNAPEIFVCSLNFRGYWHEVRCSHQNPKMLVVVSP